MISQQDYIELYNHVVKVKDKQHIQYAKIATDLGLTPDQVKHFFTRQSSKDGMGRGSVFLLSRIADSLGIPNDWAIKGINMPESRYEIFCSLVDKYLSEKDKHLWLYQSDDYTESENMKEFRKRKISDIPILDNDIVLSQNVQLDYKVQNSEVHEYFKDDGNGFEQKSNVSNVLIVAEQPDYYNHFLFNQVANTSEENLIIVDNDSLIDEVNQHLQGKGYDTAELDISDSGRKPGYKLFDICQSLQNEISISQFCRFLYQFYESIEESENKKLKTVCDTIKHVFTYICKNFNDFYTLDNIRYILYKMYFETKEDSCFFLHTILAYTGMETEEYKFFKDMMDGKLTEPASDISHKAFQIID